MSRLLISTDLDGTLLDHFSYSTEPANQLFALLEQQQIPWIFNTSKTASELKALKAELDNIHPCVVENGGAVLVPAEHPLSGKTQNEIIDGFSPIVLGAQRAAILEALEPLRSQFKFRGFNDLTLEQLVELTGLNSMAATSALDRHYSEPLIWEDSAEAREKFSSELARSGLITQAGGRFLHVMGRSNKAKALEQLRAAYTELWQEQIEVMALGDGENDTEMLEAADIAVQIKSPTHSFPVIGAVKRLIRTEREGPKGWYDAVSQVLEERAETNAQ